MRFELARYTPFRAGTVGREPDTVRAKMSADRKRR